MAIMCPIFLESKGLKIYKIFFFYLTVLIHLMRLLYRQKKRPGTSEYQTHRQLGVRVVLGGLRWAVPVEKVRLWEHEGRKGISRH